MRPVAEPGRGRALLRRGCAVLTFGCSVVMTVGVWHGLLTVALLGSAWAP